MIIEPGITIPSGITITSTNTFGQVLYTGSIAPYDATTPSSTTYTWVCPSDVWFVSVVCIGAGGAGGPGGALSQRGGGGGGLGWKNSIPVVPGQSYTVAVGDGPPRASPYGASPGVDGGNSYFIDLSTVAGYGGQAGTNGSSGGLYVGDGGGAGGNGSTYGGGGGAGGYSGAGGDGDSGAATISSGAASGGDGRISGQYGGGGGGVGTLGQGTSGVGPGKPGSGGTRGDSYGYGDTYPDGGNYGGGGGRGGGDTGVLPPGGRGGIGAVRIIWGLNRAFPSTNTGNL